MSEEQRRRAFTSFLSTTKQRGTGLGLAIVGRVIETHRGKVKIRSRLGVGTIFSITLPVQ
jgi:signal transduction histidine kinase